MTNRNGRAKPFSHKDHVIALQGEVHELVQQLDAAMKAGIKADTQRMLYAQIVSTLMLKQDTTEVLLEPDDYDRAMVECSMRFTTEWKDRGDGTRNACIRLVPNDDDLKAKQTAAVADHRKRIDEALRAAQACLPLEGDGEF